MLFNKDQYIKQNSIAANREFLDELEFIERFSKLVNQNIKLESSYDTMTLILLKFTSKTNLTNEDDFISLDFYPYNFLQFQFFSNDGFNPTIFDGLTNLGTPEYIEKSNHVVILNTGKIELNNKSEIIIAQTINSFFHSK